MVEKMKFNFGKTVYIDASVVSYLMAETFTNPAKIARQLATNDWLDFWGSGFEIFTSTLAIEEAKRGHHEDVARATEGLDGITRLPVTNAANALTEAIRRALPPDSRDDAFHIALAAVHDTNYILTWKSRLLDRDVPGVAGFLEDNTKDVSEWVSDLFGALEELGTIRYQDLAEITTWAIYTERTNEAGWESADLYTEIFCDRVFSILGSSDFEKESIKDCNNSYKPDAEDEAYDDWWSGQYGTGA